ncbi:MAG: hypothetical protein UW94_C0020G0028 [Parcubacteria group bacterium GW2011_GWA2_45_14]|nr:MAG: hypothetical protein UW94_C0020G0028 [Parcubacteria group bacterium GW2011_GWA2_45_14]
MNNQNFLLQNVVRFDIFIGFFAPVRKSQIPLARLALLGDQIVRDFGRKNQLAVLS